MAGKRTHKTEIKPTQLVHPTEPAKKKNFLQRSVPVYIFLLFLIIPACSLGFYFHCLEQKVGEKEGGRVTGKQETNVQMMRLNDQNLVHPLLFVDIESEQFLSGVREKVTEYLQAKRSGNAFTSASVYVKDLNDGMYFSINADSLYDPASLMKVPLMITYLKLAEANPALLKKKHAFKRNPLYTTVRTINDIALTDGKTYTVEELLYYMIVYSDNDAFWLLNENIDQNLLLDLDKKLGIPSNFDVLHYPASEKHTLLTVNSIAHYFNILYNASYLNKNLSTYALDLLTKSTFKDGITKDMGPNLLIAHKFGERTISYMREGKLENLQSEFHEFGIIYLQNRPYLLGVMTRGNESKPLQEVVRNVAKIVYDDLNSGGE
jgi:beta-lactamase class A